MKVILSAALLVLSTLPGLCQGSNYSVGPGSPIPSVHTRQIFTTGTAATYTKPAGARQIIISMWAGGGGGAGSDTGAGDSTNGGSGGDTIFNSVHAGGGSGGVHNGGGSSGGSGGTGSASYRLAGAPGQNFFTTSFSSATDAFITGGFGGGFGGGRSLPAQAGQAGVANTGGGGSGGGIAPTTFATLALSNGGPGGGQGEFAQIVINSPSSTYTYTVGAGGSAGVAGTGGSAGGAGGSGLIVVDEYY